MTDAPQLIFERRFVSEGPSLAARLETHTDDLTDLDAIRINAR
jgi:hypothetical protein